MIKSAIRHAAVRSNGERLRPRPPSSRAAFLLAMFAVIAFLYFARAVALPLLLACVLSMALRPAVDFCVRIRFPRALAAGLAVLAFVAAAGGIAYWIGRPAAEWAHKAPQTIAQFRDKVEDAVHLRHTPPVSPEPSPDTTPAPAPPRIGLPNFEVTSAILSWTSSTLSGVAETIVLLYLLLASGDWFWTRLPAALAPQYEETEIAKSSQRLQHEISRYLFSISVINAAFGVLMGAGLAIIGLPNAAMWGVVAALLNFIPYFGAAVGMIAVGIVGFLTFGSAIHEALPLVLYVGLHIAEADFVTPAILGKRFAIQPLIVFLSLLFWTWLWGPIGAFLATPLLVALKVASESFPEMSSVGELLSR